MSAGPPGGAQLGDVLDRIPVGVLIHRETGIVYANQEGAQLLVGPGRSPLGRNLLEFVEPAERAALETAFLDCLHGGVPVRTMDVTLLGPGAGPDGHPIRTQVSMAPLPWDGPAVAYVVVTDVTTLKENEDRLQVLAITDPLTGLFNRRHFMELAESELNRSRRYGGQVSLLSVDIDHFKHINDAFGHAIGDRALKAFADGCRSMLRTNDIFGRIGGEEFAILLPETGADAARAAAERLRETIAGLRVPAGRRTIHFTISAGVSSCRDGDRTLDALLSSADKALYRAKHGGRNRVVVAADTPAP
ncbi:GGDEF domain-containing protein [Azospirillum thermophilum]|uniref:diguanylate cyclase n=1 Tax=Azospirillum thermophilum TaxID=2202148 RepID=A0A2S2CNN3_9PROT|nr:GGDEF domain-containing protein [Azospirillum thermophilum]AWK86068.1 hypothetical protein DEW08_07220 [Azospirillum thermophilum]